MSDDCIFIEGFGIGNYKSFREIQYFGPCKKINILIGQNNAGKSNVLNFLRSYFDYFIRAICEQTKFDINPQDKNDQISEEPVSFSFGIYQGKKKAESNFKFFKITDMVTEATAHKVIYELPRNLINKIADLNTTLKQYEIKKIAFPRRYDQVGLDIEAEITFTREQMVKRIQQLCNAGIYEPGERQLYKKLTQNLKRLLSDKIARLYKPNFDHLELELQNGTHKLEDWGSGIHQLVTIAVACSVLSKQIICIDEPELNLHPTMQRKLIEFLENETDNQYFITTHSAHIMDAAEDPQIFHMKLVDGASVVTPIFSDHSRFQICKDLGYKASDLLQSNCVIWVEGPSDRMYLNHWLAHKNQKLREGVDYSIMFYGGKLLSRLTVDERENEEAEEENQHVSDFIELQKINRHFAILIDSDRKSEKDQIRETKTRIESEVNANEGFVWITSGREIENYLNRDILTTSVRKTHSVKHKDFISSEGQFDLSLPQGKPDKDKIAKSYISMDTNPDFAQLDLNEKIEGLVAFIQQANSTK